MLSSSHFAVSRRPRGGVRYLYLTELPDTEAAQLYRLGENPVVYVYSPATGNMTMRHPSRWRPLSVMDRQPSRPKGARPGLPNDEQSALTVAESHFRRYRPRKFAP